MLTIVEISFVSIIVGVVFMIQRSWQLLWEIIGLFFLLKNSYPFVIGSFKDSYFFIQKRRNLKC